MKIKSKDAAIRRIRPIALGVAIASAVPMAAQAAIIELYAESTYSMGGAAASTIKDPASGPTRTSGYVDVLKFENLGTNSIGLHSYGSDVGDFGSRSSGAGIYDVSGLFRIKEQVTNTSGAATSAQFSFNITPGILSNDIWSLLGSGDYVKAAISFEVIATRSSAPGTPVTVWSSNASLISDATALGQFTAGGNDTSFYVPNAFYSNGVHYDVQSFAKTLDLGLLNPGETLDLTYEIKSSAQGHSSAGGIVEVPDRNVIVPGHWEWDRDWFSNAGPPGNASNGVCYGGYGEFSVAAVIDGYGGNPVVPGDPGTPPTDSPCWRFVAEHTEFLQGYSYSTDNPSGSQASSGDPFTLDLAGADNFPGYFVGTLPLQGGLGLANVPEPGALSLLGLGLMAGWLARRRSS